MLGLNNRIDQVLGYWGVLLSGTMSSVTKNKEDANVLKNRQGMRNVGTIGAAIAT